MLQIQLVACLAVSLLLAVTGPTRAQTPEQLADPAFAEAFARLLAANDRDALVALHAAAEAGNTAALLALPAALDWLRVPLKDRRPLLVVNGVRLADAVIAASPVAADWAGGDPYSADINDVTARALRLYDAGEQEKADGFVLFFVNQTGSFAPLPEGLFDRPLSAMVEYFVLGTRLGDPTNPDKFGTAALAAARLRAGSPGAAMALAQVAGLHRPDGPAIPEQAAQLPAIIAAAGLTADEGAKAMAGALPALQLVARREMPTTEMAMAGSAFLQSSPDLDPTEAACAAACPATRAQCVAAWTLAFGLPQGRGGIAQPPVAVIPAARFWASPRGIDLLFGRAFRDETPEFASGPLMQAASALDACFAQTAASSLP